PRRSPRSPPSRPPRWPGPRRPRRGPARPPRSQGPRRRGGRSGIASSADNPEGRGADAVLELADRLELVSADLEPGHEPADEDALLGGLALRDQPSVDEELHLLLGAQALELHLDLRALVDGGGRL